MKISMYAMSVDTFVPNLVMLSKLLEKGVQHASDKKFESAILVNARLAPDMLPLSKQIQIACDMAKNGCARLAAQEPPRFEDNESTMDELVKRIARTSEYLKSIPASAFEAADTRDIKVPAGDRTLEFKGLDFLQRWAIPNVFFHVTTAYNILRHNGVELGKRDFINAGKEM